MISNCIDIIIDLALFLNQRNDLALNHIKLYVMQMAVLISQKEINWNFG